MYTVITHRKQTHRQSQQQPTLPSVLCIYPERQASTHQTNTEQQQITNTATQYIFK